MVLDDACAIEWQNIGILDEKYTKRGHSLRDNFTQPQKTWNVLFVQ